MSHRTDAEGSIDAARVTLAELLGRLTPTDITMANAARAQAIATAAVAQALLALDDTLAAYAQAQQPETGLPAEQPCTDPRHTGAIRERLGCSGPDPATT